MAPNIFSFILRHHELRTARAKRSKVTIGIAASLTLLAGSLLPASGAPAAEFKEPDYSKFKVEEGQITLEFWS
jgi:hypothetical protein